MAVDHGPSMAQALSQYLASLNATGRRDGHQELNRFVHWCGRSRPVGALSPPEIGEYAESAGMWGADSTKKLEPVKSFLAYLKRKGLIAVGLAPHLKASRSKSGTRRVYFKSVADHAELSPQGFANLQSRLEMLKQERTTVVADIGRAMADKDFKENAPLDAAKERQGMIESSIRELEGVLTYAVVIGSAPTEDLHLIKIGRKVTLKDIGNGKKVVYTLVDSRETDPVTGKISNVSPVGKALMDRSVGEEVSIAVPSGTLRYVIEKVES